MQSINELLNEIRFSNIEIKSLISLKNKIESNASSINSNISEKVSGSKKSDRTANFIVDYVDLEKVIDEKLKILTDAKKIALNTINRLNNPLQRVILIERYFNDESWKSISIIIGRSEKWAKQTHDKAIKLCEING